MAVMKKMAMVACIIGICFIGGQAIAGHGPGDGTGNGGDGPGDCTGNGPGTGDCLSTLDYDLGSILIAGRGYGPGDGSGDGDHDCDGDGNGPGTGDCLNVAT